MFVFLLVIGVTAITLQLTVHKVWERTLREQIERNLKQKTLMFAYRVEADRQHSLADITAQEGQAAGARATVIDPTGKVLADSEADAEHDGESRASQGVCCRPRRQGRSG